MLISANKKALKEVGFLKLDSTKIKKQLGYQPIWHIAEYIKNLRVSKVLLIEPENRPRERQTLQFFINSRK